jgi:hypothetical protein
MCEPADGVKRAIDTWPPIAALPLCDLYAATEPARVRLWAACELAEMLARLMVVLDIAELAAVGEGRLPPDLLRKLSGLIEESTLGVWREMAEAVAKEVQGIEAPLFKELPDLVGRLGRLVAGQGTARPAARGEFSPRGTQRHRPWRRRH